MKTVAIYRSSLLPVSETFIKEQALALTRWKPILVGYRKVADGLDLGGLNVHLLPGMMAGRLQRWHTKLRQWLGQPHQPTTEVLRGLGVDLVHAHFGTDATDIWPSVKAAGLPMLVTLHGYDINVHREWWESGKGGLRRRTYPRRLLAMAREPNVRFIAVSKAIRQRAIDYGIPGGKITVRYIGVDTSRFRPDGLPITQRPKRILFVGRMVEKKAPQLLIRAFDELRAHYPDTEMHMVGDGPLLPAAKALAMQLGCPVKFFGRVDTTKVLNQINQAALLCLPSVTTPRGDAEGFGMVLLEAQACGVPVITSALGGAVEAIAHGKTGYAFTPGNKAELIMHIAHIFDHPAVAASMSRAATAFVRHNFDIRILAPYLQIAYDETSVERIT